MDHPRGSIRTRLVPTLASEVYSRIRAEIVQGSLRPNERLVESELADRLGISRTPVREGLQRLAADGLVKTHRRGWIVHEHTPHEITELFEARAALEGFAAWLAATRGTDAFIATILEMHSPNPLALLDTPRDHLVTVNESFHEAIITAAGNDRLSHLVRQSREVSFVPRIAELYTDDEARRALAGHERIVKALASRDAEEANRAMRDHILEALQVMLPKYR